jgi:uncharacterized protein YfaQ (DUF2300 family)
VSRLPRALALALAFGLALSAGRTAQASSCTVGTGATVCVAARSAAPYRYIEIDNESASATIACTIDGTTPAANTAGSFTIATLQQRIFAAANATFSGPLTCISSAASTPVTYIAQ